MRSEKDLFPLEVVSIRDLQNLAECLWQWHVCDPCKNEQLVAVHDNRCAWRLGCKGMSAFFTFYRAVTQPYVPELHPGMGPALQDQNSLIELIRAIKAAPNTPRSDLRRLAFSGQTGSGHKVSSSNDQDRAIDMALKVLMMTNSMKDEQTLIGLESGVKPVVWQDGDSLVQFFDGTFPSRSGQGVHSKGRSGWYEVQASLGARRLTKRARLRFEPTDDIGEHLSLDENEGVVMMFHHVGYLRECLMASLSVAGNADIAAEIQQ
jgi:hypothetical protein